MKVLIACEESQAVCIEFRKRGHEAYSCDIQECSGGHPEWHIQGNVLEQLEKYWDMVIAFPPCTHLCVSGARWFEEKRKDGRQQQGIDFFMEFTKLECPWCIENPIGIMSDIYRKPDQIIQPWMFGHPETKATCLWLNKLPCLMAKYVLDEDLFAEKIELPENDEERMRIWGMTNSDGKKVGWNTEEIKILRSKTFPGIAKAMAEQWGAEPRNQLIEVNLF